MKIDLNDKTALVTGGTSEVGTAICKQLAMSGAKVVSDYQNRDEAEEWREKLSKQGFDVNIYAADLTDFDSCNKLIEMIESDLGAIDIVVNSAEIVDECLFKQMEKTQWDALLSSNLDSVFNLCRHAADRMSERGFGRIINISSRDARKGSTGKTHYAASKAGMHGFTMALAQEVAHKGVTVNTVSPGSFTNGQAGNEDPNIHEIPAGRLGQLDELAYLVDFLCSEQAAYINGTDIAINGGHYMQ